LAGKVIPGAEEVAAAIAKRDRARIVPTGVHALNILGLRSQVTMKVVYLTDGAARIVRVGKQTINFKRSTPKNLAAKGHISSLVIQALKTIGKTKITENELNKIIVHLKKEKWENILYDSKLAPAWIAVIMKKALKIDECREI
jgi:septum formation inhibitor-activating ATPase MinD